MTTRRHQITLYGPFGRYLADVPVASLSYTLAELKVGELSLTLPPDLRLPYDAFARDAILLVTRTVAGAVAEAQPWLVRRRRLARGADGLVRLQVNAVHRVDDPDNIGQV